MNAPVTRLVIPLSLGILIADWWPFLPLWVAVTGAAVLLAVCVAMVCLRGSKNGFMRVAMPLLAVAVLLTGYASMLSRAPERQPDRYARWCPAEATWADQRSFEGVVRETPLPGRKSFKVVVDVCAMTDSCGLWQPCSGRMMCFFQKSREAASLQVGQRVVARGVPRVPSDSLGYDGFNYRRYLHRKGIERQCYVDSSSFVVVGGGEASVQRWFSSLRGRMMVRIERAGLSREQEGIAEAMLLGWDEAVDEATRQRFQCAGIAHLLCVSGLHVGVVAWLLGLVFCWAGRRKGLMILKSVVQLSGVWCFVLLTGAAPSAMRAGLMFSLMVIGRNLFDSYNIYNNLCISALLLLLINPGVLFAIGFQLSYSAVFGIAAARPLMHLPFVKLRDGWRGLPAKVLVKVWEFTCVSIAAQVATMPLIVYYFHQLPVYFLIANLIVVPFAGLLLGTALALAVFVDSNLLGTLFSRLVALELDGVGAVTRWVSQLPHAVVDGIYMTLPMTWLLGAILVVVAKYINVKHQATTVAQPSPDVLSLIE
ncbi:MAG: ComEC family competence protein [Bacteroidales bacterium]|nr:ComEC family competence protein [Bacteroidales bacterium]